MEKIIGVCPDCGEENVEIPMQGKYANMCGVCAARKQHARARNKEYIPYLKLSEEAKLKIQKMKEAQRKSVESKKSKAKIKKEPMEVKIPDSNDYYSNKAKKSPIPTHTAPIVAETTSADSKSKITNALSDQNSFINILNECGCEIPNETLSAILDVLVNTDKLKNIFMTVAENDNQQAMLDLDQSLNAVERKLQHNWEYNGFQEIDDIKFKGFLVWRRTLKGAIFFWKKLYSTGALLELQRAWNSYTANPNDKKLLAGDTMVSVTKRYQITTETVSTILNTRRPFTRVFYAPDKDNAYEKFKQWLADRNLHEDTSKTTIVELTNNDSVDGREREER